MTNYDSEPGLTVFLFAEASKTLSGKMAASLAELLGSVSSVQRVLNRAGDYVDRDADIEGYLQQCEALVNIVFETFLEDYPKIQEIIETNPHHGYAHVRRVEKILKKIDAEGAGWRHNQNYLFFKVAAFFAVRLHDLTQVATGMKSEHDTTAALFALGYLLQIFDEHILQLITRSTKQNQQLAADWNKIAWATAFIVLHHSQPESMPPPQHILSAGKLFEPKRILSASLRLVRSSEKELAHYFPPYAAIPDYLHAHKLDTLPPPLFSSKEILAIVQHARAVAVADKIDSILPADLSAARMILTMPGRLFYKPLSNEAEQFPLDKELNLRVKDGGAPRAACDLNRILYEISRTGSFKEIGAWVSRVYKGALAARSAFLKDAIPCFLNRNFQPYKEMFDRSEQRETLALLLKLGVDRSIAHVIAGSRSKDRTQSIQQLLGERRTYYDQIMHAIQTDRDEVLSALAYKYEQVGALPDKTTERINQLLLSAIAKQRRALRGAARLQAGDVPYTSYYAPPVPEKKV